MALWLSTLSQGFLGDHAAFPNGRCLGREETLGAASDQAGLAEGGRVILWVF